MRIDPNKPCMSPKYFLGLGESDQSSGCILSYLHTGTIRADYRILSVMYPLLYGHRRDTCNNPDGALNLELSALNPKPLTPKP